MPNTIRLKRSATAGKVPLASDLQLGELAVNTNDGKLYLKKDDGAASILEVGPVTSVAGRTGAVTLAVADIAGSVTSVAGRTGAVALAIADVADLAASLTPIGAVIPYAGLSAPPRWLFCFGQNVSRTTYAALFAAISTTYGAGDGTTTFTLPDLRGRVVAGQDDMGGASANRLTGQSGGVDGDLFDSAGGAEIYTLFLPLAGRIVRTVVHGRYGCDTFFPSTALDQWRQTARDERAADEKNPVACSFTVWERSPAAAPSDSESTTVDETTEGAGQ